MSTIQHPPGAGGEQVPRGRGADPTAAGETLGGFETRLLAELQMLVTERVATAGQEAGPAGRRAGKGTVRHPAAARGPARRAWPTRRLAMTGGLAASLAAILAATLTLTSAGGARPPAPNFAPPVTAAAVLNNAALAAQREPVRKPRPDQFVYSKSFMAYTDAIPPAIPGRPWTIEHGTDAGERWASVSGTRPGGFSVDLTRNAVGHTQRDRSTFVWCAHGYFHPAPKFRGQVEKDPCTAASAAAYLPHLPTTAAGMRAFLQGQLRLPDTASAKLIEGHGPHFLLAGGFYILTWYYLTPAQQAAMYHALAGVTGLTVVPKVTDVQGAVGVGVRYHSAAKHITWTAIFDPTTFKPLGANIDMPRQRNRVAIVVPPTLVNKAGQRP